MDDAGVGRDDLEVVERALAPAQEGVALAVALELELGVARERRRVANSSTCTEWSITSSAGSSGLICAGSPPRSRIASRIAARSTTAGTPVKSWSRTRAGRKEISRLGSSVATQPATASTSSSRPCRSTFSSRIAQRVRQPRDVAALLERVEPEDLVALVPDRGQGLDSACGTGELSELAARAGADVVGIDFAPFWSRRQRRCSREGPVDRLSRWRRREPGTRGRELRHGHVDLRRDVRAGPAARSGRAGTGDSAGWAPRARELDAGWRDRRDVPG